MTDSKKTKRKVTKPKSAAAQKTAPAALNKNSGAAALNKEEAAGLDPEPARNPAKGDLDLAYIEWYRRNRSPKEFAEKYRNGERLKFLEQDNTSKP